MEYKTLDTASFLDLSTLPEQGQELFTTFLETDTFKIERIHSNQAASPADFWHD